MLISFYSTATSSLF